MEFIIFLYFENKQQLSICKNFHKLKELEVTNFTQKNSNIKRPKVTHLHSTLTLSYYRKRSSKKFITACFNFYIGDDIKLLNMETIFDE